MPKFYLVVDNDAKTLQLHSQLVTDAVISGYEARQAIGEVGTVEIDTTEQSARWVNPDGSYHSRSRWQQIVNDLSQNLNQMPAHASDWTFLPPA